MADIKELLEVLSGNELDSLVYDKIMHGKSEMVVFRVPQYSNDPRAIFAGFGLDAEMGFRGFYLSLQSFGNTWAAIYGAENKTGPRVVHEDVCRAICGAALGVVLE